MAFGFLGSRCERNRSTAPFDKCRRRFIYSPHTTTSGKVRSNRIMDTIEGVLWRPSTDVYEDENDIIIHVDLPGVPKEDITIDTTENEITIHGEAKRPGEFVAASSRVRERNIGKFRKIVRLPTGVDMNNVKTKYENGLLEVRVPKGSYSGKRIQLK
ncbi:HSP20-like chaperone [Paraphysoderma sedebokerense]|nr:HSP20-like chaperone [Paraphysoderma sedebokerense]